MWWAALSYPPNKTLVFLCDVFLCDERNLFAAQDDKSVNTFLGAEGGIGNIRAATFHTNTSIKQGAVTADPASPHRQRHAPC